MSWVSGRPQYLQGDPGLFSVLGKIAGGIANVATGGLAGTAYNAVKGILRPGPASPSTALQTVSRVRLPPQMPTAFTGQTGPLIPTPIALPGGAVIDSIKVKGTGVTTPFGSFGSASGTAYLSQPGAPTGTQLVCTPDGRTHLARTHANKSGYYTHPRGNPGSATYVPPGSKCVANRRRNPLNPRALSRAMSRVASAQKAVRHLIRFEKVARGGKINIRRPTHGCRRK